MAEITAASVKELRERTGAGMMDCKKALISADGDMAKAEDIIAKSGFRKAAKSASRTAAEGVVVAKTSSDQKLAALLEVNCETDFVARDANFKTFVQKVIDIVLSKGLNSIEAVSNAEYKSGQTIEEARQTLVAAIGENIQVRRVKLVAAEGNGSIGVYTHNDRIGVLVELTEKQDELAKDLAMQVAAMNPQFVKSDEVPEEVVNREKAILVERARESGKPDNIIEKIIGGQLNKYVAEICLVGQKFIKDSDKTVADLLKANNTDIKQMVRFEVGEGIQVEKKSFEEEVMEQVRGS